MCGEAATKKLKCSRRRYCALEPIVLLWSDLWNFRRDPPSTYLLRCGWRWSFVPTPLTPSLFLPWRYLENVSKVLVLRERNLLRKLDWLIMLLGQCDQNQTGLALIKTRCGNKFWWISYADCYCVWLCGLEKSWCVSQFSHYYSTLIGVCYFVKFMTTFQVCTRDSNTDVINNCFSSDLHKVHSCITTS